MSRTDKDAPWHVRAQWWEPAHWRCEHAQSSRWRRHLTERVCDLPPEPDPASYDRTRRMPRHCRWEPVWDRYHYGDRTAPKWYIDHVWNNPNRVAVRDLGRRAVAEHRATGEVDVVLPIGQHRHRAQWMWW